VEAICRLGISVATESHGLSHLAKVFALLTRPIFLDVNFLCTIFFAIRTINVERKCGTVLVLCAKI